MTSAASPQPRPPEVANGFWTLLTSAITIVIVLVGTLQIEPRLSERRLRIDERYILTSEEVAALPPETLARGRFLSITPILEHSETQPSTQCK